MKKKNCSVPICRNYYVTHPNVTFHSFPSNAQLRKVWLEKINCPELTDMSEQKLRNHVICSEHFEFNQFRSSDKKKLNFNAIPRIFFICDPRSMFFQKSEPEDLESILSELPEECRDLNTVLHITPIQETEDGTTVIKYKVDTICITQDIDENLTDNPVDEGKIMLNVEIDDSNTWEPETVINMTSIEPVIAPTDHYQEEKVDMNKICRLCLSDKNLQPLFLTGTSKYYYVQKLESFTQLKMTELDALPKQICHACSLKVDTVFNFVKKCTATDAFLRDKLGLIIYDHTYQKNGAERLPKLKEEMAENESPPITVKDRDYLEDDLSEYEVEHLEDDTDYIAEHGANQMNKFMELPNNGELKGSEVGEMQNEVKVKLEDEDEYEELNIDEFLNGLSHKKPAARPKCAMKYMCRHCMMRFRSIADLEEHRQQDEKCARARSYECKVCGGLFVTYTELHQHRVEQKHTANHRKRTCNVCRKTIMRHLGAHMRTHTKEQPYCCEVCGMLFNIAGNLKRHLQTKHNGERNYKCEVCGKTYTAKHTLNEHMHTHTGQRPYVCSCCGKGFAQQGALNLHARTHKKGSAAHGQPGNGLEDLGQLPGGGFQCSTCGQVFKRRGALQYHITSHADRKHKCEECGRMFLTLQSLHQHYQIHVKVKPFPCQYCDKRFGFSSALKIHMVTHTGERPYKCDVCSMTFTQRSHVRTHMRTHDGERPYSCHICGKKFALNGNLTVHMRIHTGEQPFRCEVCGRGFYDSSSMKKHVRAHVNS